MLILQPTPFCNIDCKYCYLPHRDDRRRMPDEVLEAVFSKLLPSPLVQDRLAVVWHAGEPLTVPPDWYEAAFDIADRHRGPGQTLQHAFQSNGLLLNANWISFFRRTGARISLSIDGPDWLHDRSRRTRANGGTHERAMSGLRLLQQNEIRPAVITVLTREALDQPDMLFDFYRDAGIDDVAFNIEEIEGVHAGSSMAGEQVEQAYRAFVGRFIERMRDEPEILTLREVRDALGVLRHGVLPGFNQEAEPMRIISIGRDGAVSTFSPEFLGMQDDRYENFVFGNILTDGMGELTDRVLNSALCRDIAAGVANCERICGWFAWCGGGSPSNKLFEVGTPRATETMFCRLTRQALLDVVMTSVEREQTTAVPA